MLKITQNTVTDGSYEIKHIWSSLFHLLKYTTPSEALKGWFCFFSADMQNRRSMFPHTQITTLSINLFQEVKFHGWFYAW